MASMYGADVDEVRHAQHDTQSYVSAHGMQGAAAILIEAMNPLLYRKRGLTSTTLATIWKMASRSATTNASSMARFSFCI